MFNLTMEDLTLSIKLKIFISGEMYKNLTTYRKPRLQFYKISSQVTFLKGKNSILVKLVCLLTK